MDQVEQVHLMVGKEPQQALETYQEGGQHYTYPQPQDEQPQAQYMQGMPLQH